jgi:hypothetical protein
MLSANVLIETKVAHVAQALTKLAGCGWLRTSPAPTTSSRECRRPASTNSAGWWWLTSSSWTA